MGRDIPEELEALRRLPRAQLHARVQRYFKTAGPTEPEVALVALGQARAVLKDYAHTPGWFGRLIAPILIYREASALSRLAGLAGVPALYRRLDARGLLIEYLPGVAWPQARAPDAAYPRLTRLVAAMHRRGVAHGDLRAPGNMLVDAQGRPYIVDFVARVRRGQRWNPAWNWIFRRFVAADESALAKLRLRYAPHLASAHDRVIAAQRGPLARAARRAGAGVRRLTRFFARTG